MSFATLQEAWGVPTFGYVEEEPIVRKTDVQSEVLERTEASQRSLFFVKNYLRDVYNNHGVAGITSLMDEDMTTALHKAAFFSFDWLDANSALFIFACLCAFWLLMDIARK